MAFSFLYCFILTFPAVLCITEIVIKDDGSKIIEVHEDFVDDYFSNDPIEGSDGDCAEDEYFNQYGAFCTRDCIIYRLGNLICDRDLLTQTVAGCYCLTDFVRAEYLGPCVTLEECSSYKMVMVYGDETVEDEM